MAHVAQAETTLHPSNPYYTYSRHLDEQCSAILAPYEPPTAKPQQQPQRSLSVDDSKLSGSSPSPPEVPQPQQTSQESRKRNIVTYRTRSIGGPFSSGVYFERRIDLSPPNDAEIIIATVRVTNTFRRASIEGCSDLPSRPPKRTFLRRMSTRISSPTDRDRYTAMKMPRGDYKKHFARDREGKYAGTEPEREWSEEDLRREFGEFQDMPLRSIPGGSEFGEGDRPGGGGSGKEEEERVWRELAKMEAGEGRLS